MRRRTTPLTRMLIGTCLVLYVATLVLDPGTVEVDPSPLAFLSPGSRALYQLGMTGAPVWQLGWWWTVLTATFLHGSLLHVAFNMLWVRELAPIVERSWGPARLLVLFCASGAAGFLASNVMLGAPTIGASGAVFGLLAALIVLGRRRNATAFASQIWRTALVVFAIGFLLPGVNNWGHAGGFGGGWMAASILPLREEGREGPAIRLLAGAVVVTTVLGMAASFTLVRQLTIG